MLEGIHAVIFDLDGTLMDSMWMWKDIDIEYLGRYGLCPPEGLDVIIEGMGVTETGEYFKYLFELPDPVEKIKEDWLVMAGEKYAHEVRLKTGAAAFLRMLRAQGRKIGIASSNSRELIQACLASNGVEDCYDCIVPAGDVAKGKPAPDVYLEVARRLDVEPENCLVFEDVPMGILSGKNAGMQVCAVRDEYCLDQTEKIRTLADYYIQSYDEIPEHRYEELKHHGERS